MAKPRKTMAKPRGTVDLYTTTRDLLKRIIAMPGNGRSQPAMLDNLVHDEAVRLGLIEGPDHETKCPTCGDELLLQYIVGGTVRPYGCRNPACDYRC